MTLQNCDIFIPVRTDSSRLPKKHLLEINGTALLKILIERLKKAKKIRKIIVCTTTLSSDDVLVKFLKKENIEYFRGDKQDILKRFSDAAKFFKTDIIIDVEGDKIYTDPIFVDKVVDEMTNSDVDFVIGNDNNSSFNPNNHLVHGFIPAGIKINALEKICKLKNTSNTATGYKEFFLQPNLFKTKFLVLKTDESLYKKIRLTIDYYDDYILADKIFNELDFTCSFQDIIELLIKKPELLKIVENSISLWEKSYRKNIIDFSLKSNL